MSRKVSGKTRVVGSEEKAVSQRGSWSDKEKVPHGISETGNDERVWPITRLRYVAHLNPSVRDGLIRAVDTEVSFLPMEAIGEDGRINLERTRPVAEVRNGYSYFEDGDVAFAKVTPCFENGKGALMRGLERGAGFGTTELTVLRPKLGTNPIFLNYVLQSSRFRQLGAAAMTGAGGLKRVPDEFTQDFETPWPTAEDQTRIANFLDEQTARIDALIAEKERLVESLGMASYELLHAVVTKGLRNTPMAYSGVEWIGEMPKHWSAPYVKFVAKLESGHTPSRQHPEYWDNCTIPWFSLADVWQIRSGAVEIVTQTEEMVSELGLQNSSARLLPAKTVMLSRTASVGFSAIMGVPMATTQDFVNWVCGPSVLPEYLLYVFRAMHPEFERLKYGSTHSTIYMPDVVKFKMPLPPLVEQADIVEAARARKQRLDELKSVAIKAIERLREYRSSLISAAVTGQLDMDNYVMGG